MIIELLYDHANDARFFHQRVLSFMTKKKCTRESKQFLQSIFDRHRPSSRLFQAYHGTSIPVLNKSIYVIFRLTFTFRFNVINHVQLFSRAILL